MSNMWVASTLSFSFEIFCSSHTRSDMNWLGDDAECLLSWDGACFSSILEGLVPNDLFFFTVPIWLQSVCWLPWWYADMLTKELLLSSSSSSKSWDPTQGLRKMLSAEALPLGVVAIENGPRASCCEWGKAPLFSNKSPPKQSDPSQNDTNAAPKQNGSTSFSASLTDFTEIPSPCIAFKHDLGSIQWSFFSNDVIPLLFNLAANAWEVDGSGLHHPIFEDPSFILECCLDVIFSSRQLSEPSHNKVFKESWMTTKWCFFCDQLLMQRSPSIENRLHLLTYI